MVRLRAELPVAKETEQSKLRAIIEHERRMELAFKNKRWLDLVRTGRAIEVMNKNGVYLKSRFNHLLPASYKVTQNHLFVCHSST